MPEIGDLVMSCRSLGYEEEPDYQQAINLLKKMQIAKGRESTGCSKQSVVSPTVSKSPKRKQTEPVRSAIESSPIGRTKTKQEVAPLEERDTEETGPFTSRRRRSSEGVFRVKITAVDHVLCLRVISGENIGHEFLLSFKSGNSIQIGRSGEGLTLLVVLLMLFRSFDAHLSLYYSKVSILKLKMNIFQKNMQLSELALSRTQLK